MERMTDRGRVLIARDGEWRVRTADELAARFVADVLDLVDEAATRGPIPVRPSMIDGLREALTMFDAIDPNPASGSRWIEPEDGDDDRADVLAEAVEDAAAALALLGYRDEWDDGYLIESGVDCPVCGEWVADSDDHDAAACGPAGWPTLARFMVADGPSGFVMLRPDDDGLVFIDLALVAGIPFHVAGCVPSSWSNMVDHVREVVGEFYDCAPGAVVLAWAAVA